MATSPVQLSLFDPPCVSPTPGTVPAATPEAPLPTSDPTELLRELNSAQQALSEAMIAGAPLDEQRRLEQRALELRRHHVLAFQALPDQQAVERALAKALGHKPHRDMVTAYEDLRRAAAVRRRT